jgi:mannitol-specific phosphotransferase system IIBC component
MFYTIPGALLNVLLNANKTGHHFNNVLGIAYNMVTSFIGV